MYQGTLAAVSNSTPWVDSGTITDPETDSLVDLTGYEIEIFISREDSPKSALVTASTSNGKVTITGTGTFAWEVPKAEMSRLRSGTYAAFVRATDPSGDEILLFSGEVNVIEGGPL